MIRFSFWGGEFPSNTEKSPSSWFGIRDGATTSHGQRLPDPLPGGQGPADPHDPEDPFLKEAELRELLGDVRKRVVSGPQRRGETTMTEWSVYCEARGAAKSRLPLDQLMDLLVEDGAAVSGGCGQWSATVTVDALDALGAAGAGARLVEKAAARAGMPDWPFVKVEVIDHDVLAEELAVPNFPDLVGAAEAAQLLGVTKSRFHMIRQKSDFPAPMVELAAGPLWLRATIDAYNEQWTRTPGRPKKERLERPLIESPGFTRFPT
jgi:hypothetical protein